MSAAERHPEHPHLELINCLSSVIPDPSGVTKVPVVMLYADPEASPKAALFLALDSVLAIPRDGELPPAVIDEMERTCESLKAELWGDLIELDDHGAC